MRSNFIVALLVVVLLGSVIPAGAATTDSNAESANLTFNSWTAEYFNNRTFTAPSIPGPGIAPGPLALDWGTSAPLAGVNADGWSSRFTSVVNFPAGGQVTFRARADDTVTVRVDGVAVTASAPYFIDQEYVGSINLTPGNHIIVVEHTDIVAQAYLYVSWEGGGASGSTGVTGTVQTSVLNFRSGPGLNFNRVGSLLFGQTYDIQGRNADGTWAYFEANGQVGWAFASLMSFTGNFLGLPVVAGDQPPPVEPGEIVLEARPTYNMRVRSCPSTDCNQIGLVPWQNAVGVYGQSNDGEWISIRYQPTNGAAIIGWSFKSYYRLASNPEQTLPQLPVVQ